MTLIDDLKPTVFDLRGIAGELGARPFTIQVVKRAYEAGSSVFNGDDPTETVLTEITEGNGYPPKVKWLTAHDYLRGANPNATVKVGPITPNHTKDGYEQGTSFELLEQLEAEKGSEIFYIITGPGFPNGSRFQLESFNGERSLGFFIELKRCSDE